MLEFVLHHRFSENDIFVLQRADLTDFERFKLMRAKQAVSLDELSSQCAALVSLVKF